MEERVRERDILDEIWVDLLYDFTIHPKFHAQILGNIRHLLDLLLLALWEFTVTLFVFPQCCRCKLTSPTLDSNYK